MRGKTVPSLFSVVAVGAALSSSGSGGDFSPESSRAADLFACPEGILVLWA